MIVDAEGVIIKKIPYTDHSSVVHIYTNKNGLLAFLVQGLGKPKSKKNAYFQTGQILNLSYYEKEQPGLRRIKEAHLHPLTPLLLDFKAQQLVFFYCELISLSVEENYSDPPLFHLLKEHILVLNENPTLKYQSLKFVLQLSDLLGYRITATMHFPYDTEIKSKIDAIYKGLDPELNRESRSILLKHLLNRLQIEVFPNKNLKSLEVIESLFF
jgi:DNA repair protein RecO (recombination protein O)